MFSWTRKNAQPLRLILFSTDLDWNKSQGHCWGKIRKNLLRRRFSLTCLGRKFTRTKKSACMVQKKEKRKTRNETRWSRRDHVILWLIVGNYGTLLRRHANTIAAGVLSRAEIKFQSPLTLPNNLVLFQFLCHAALPCYHSSTFAATLFLHASEYFSCDQNSIALAIPLVASD